MANAYIVPFDFNPVDTHEFGALSFSYTVPAGKYAIVDYCLHARAAIRSGGTQTTDTYANNSDNVATNGTLILKAGDVLTRSVTAPSGSTGSVSNAETTAIAEIRVNSNTVGIISAFAFYYQNSGAGATTLTRDTSATVHAQIREYNIAT